MLKGRVDGRSLTHSEILANVKLMILGGMQEPRDLIGMTLISLLSDAADFESVQSNRGLLRAAVEEPLRCFSPVGTLTRQTTRPVEIAGMKLDEGELVAAVIASANRDERRFSDPDRFDLRRNSGPHLAFGIGLHFCIGAALARLETTIALNALLDLPNLQLDPNKPPVIRGWEFRGPVSLDARWG
jgi:cytochrome P450